MSADADYRYFLDNLDELYREHGHKFLVVKNRTVVSTHDSFMDAFISATKDHALGTFIIQECVDDPEKLVQTFQSNVTIA
jgi:hypothetical protein